MPGTANHCLVTGASSGIGLAAIRQLLHRPIAPFAHAMVYAIARRATESAELAELANTHPARMQRYDVDLGDDAALAELSAEIQTHTSRLRLVFNAAGLLHDGSLQPEKALSQIKREHLARVFNLNAFAPIMLAQALLPLLKGAHTCTFASLSARVGSIGDNQIGGWYSYRASKAAQNQLLRTFAIELKRLNPQACCLLLHPGTVDTPLSTPFQSNVPADRLFGSKQAAEQLLALAGAATAEDSGRFYAWDGKQVPW